MKRGGGWVTPFGLRRVTREHRENLAKVAKQLANKAKEALRRRRSGAVAQAKKSKEGHSEDTVRLVERQVAVSAAALASVSVPVIPPPPSDSAGVRQHGRRRRQAAGGQDQGAAGLTEDRLDPRPLTPGALQDATNE